MKKITFLLTILIASFSGKAQVVISQGFDTNLGWTSTTVTNDAGATVAAWSRKTVGVSPTCSPSSGAGMAKFDAYDIPAGGAGRLTSPAITFAGLEYKVKFKMYRDNGYSSNSDNVKVYINTAANLTGATLLGTVNRSLALAPTEAAEGWYSYAFNLPSATTGTNYIIFLGTSDYGDNIYMDEVSVEQIQANDAQMKLLNMNSYIVNGATTVTGDVKNLGLTTITSADINWQLDSGAIHTQSFSGLNIANNQSYTFTHQDLWNATPGVYSMKVWVSNINNGSIDADATNDLLTKQISVVNEIFPKTVIFEEGTGTWCGWCVRGHVGLKDMYHEHPDGSFIGIAVHNADPMTLAAYDTAIAGFISGYPSGTVNRVHSEVDPGPTSLEPAYQAELARVPLAKVGIPTQSWDSATRQISLDVETKFALDLATANYKVAAIVVEDGVVGTTTGYDQHNYYSSQGIDIIDWEGINWRNLGAPIPAADMVYNHVGRALLGGFSGVAGSIPTAVVYNTPYTYNFTYTLPAAYVADNIKLVAIVIDVASGQIVNAKEVNLDTTLGVNNFKKGTFTLYPNPTTGVFHINSEEVVNVEVIDILGKVVATAKNVTKDSSIDVSSLVKGVYLVKMSNDKGVATDKLILK
ncbi:Omp28-related outer membrane protein [Flavobacterium sp. SUN046]|uniref:T9SS type A sorting domain-containing protein n=1 Tax=Flavobacterium sp. SUN046 TaxID=3002440 RepID=UPI002DBB31E0|nr:Omp28-related outer membrane protein [Flavobacterium sp. SUN046]MEC4049996.1 Omp28-related outer membrane protein [Flavobacterium sp. SUN046]